MVISSFFYNSLINFLTFSVISVIYIKSFLTYKLFFTSSNILFINVLLIKLAISSLAVSLSNSFNILFTAINVDKKILGNNLKDIRIKNYDNQAKIAELIKVDQSNYSKYEFGKILIHTYPLIEFAKYYEISID